MHATQAPPHHPYSPHHQFTSPYSSGIPRSPSEPALVPSLYRAQPSFHQQNPRSSSPMSQQQGSSTSQGYSSTSSRPRNQQQTPSGMSPSSASWSGASPSTSLNINSLGRSTTPTSFMTSSASSSSISSQSQWGGGIPGVGLGMARGAISGQQRSASASSGLSQSSSSGASGLPAVYHPYKRQASNGSLNGAAGARTTTKDKDRERERDKKARALEATAAAAMVNPASQTLAMQRSQSESQANGGGPVEFPAGAPGQAVAANPGAGPRTPSKDSIRSSVRGADADDRGTIRATSLPPGAAPPIIHGQQTGRSRVNSTGSSSSIGSHGTIGVAMRGGRGAVPHVFGEGADGNKGMAFREEDEFTARGGAGVGGSSATPKEAFEDAPSPSRPSHRRHSSSTSSVGAVIRPTIGGNPSFGSSSPSTVTPVNVSADMRSPTSAATGMSAAFAQKPLPGPPVSPSWKNEKEKEKEKKSGGLKGRLQKALKKDSEKEKAASPSKAQANNTPTASRPSPISTNIPNPSASPSPSPSPSRPNVTASTSAPAMMQRSHQSPSHQYNDSSSSTQSSAQPATPPDSSGLPPHIPSLGHRRPSHGSFAPSLIEPLDGRAKPKRSLFNLKNASTDNISISSTVSSASMMIRRMGALGKLARRNSLAGISKIFKDKNKDEDDLEPVKEKETKKSKKDKKNRFGSKADPASSSTSYATIDAQRPVDEDKALAGLSPAAQLARQHTLRSRAEEARVAAANARGASTREDDAASVSSGTVTPGGHLSAIPSSDFAVSGELSDSDSEADEEGYSREIEDVTARMGAARFQDAGMDTTMSSEASLDGYGGFYAWGQTYRDRHAVPIRSILKASSSYSSESASGQRTRSNSVEPPSNQEPGPLSKLSISQDIDHLEGLAPQERENELKGKHDPFSPSFSPFESGSDREPLTDRLNLPYSNPSLNTSAPVLSKVFPTKAVRAATAPLGKRKNLNWAPECAVYHTFHASEYDRRSGPATCNELTPILAQQIKDELNGYKMEEMDVHPSSRIHTHFFV